MTIEDKHQYSESFSSPQNILEDQEYEVSNEDQNMNNEEGIELTYLQLKNENQKLKDQNFKLKDAMGCVIILCSLLLLFTVGYISYGEGYKEGYKIGQKSNQ